MYRLRVGSPLAVFVFEFVVNMATGGEAKGALLISCWKETSSSVFVEFWRRGKGDYETKEHSIVWMLLICPTKRKREWNGKLSNEAGAWVLCLGCEDKWRK